MPRSPRSDSAGNGRPNGNVQVRYGRRDNRDRYSRGNPLKDSRANQGRRNSFGGEGRPDDSTDPQLKASTQVFVLYGTVRGNYSIILMLWGNYLKLLVQGPYSINKILPYSTYEVADRDGKLRGEFNKRQLKPYRTESDPKTHEDFKYEVRGSGTMWK